MKATATFEMDAEYQPKARVLRDNNRKFRVEVQGERSARMSKEHAETIALQAAEALNVNPQPTPADVDAAAALTRKLGPGVPSDESVIRRGVSLGGRTVTLTRGPFGWFYLAIKGKGEEQIRGRDSALTAYGAALASKE